MVSIGEAGYLDATKKILETAKERSRKASPRCLACASSVIRSSSLRFASDAFDIYRLLDAMSHKGWSLNGLHRPPCVHLCVTLRQAEPGVAELFPRGYLRACADEVRNTPPSKGGLAPIYGLAGSLPFTGVISDILLRYNRTPCTNRRR